MSNFVMLKQGGYGVVINKDHILKANFYEYTDFDDDEVRQREFHLRLLFTHDVYPDSNKDSKEMRFSFFRYGKRDEGYIQNALKDFTRALNSEIAGTIFLDDIFVPQGESVTNRAVICNDAKRT